MINLGEVFYRIGRMKGLQTAEHFWAAVSEGRIPLTPAAADADRIHAASILKARYPIAFADAFAVQLAVEKGLPLLSGDPELQVLEHHEPVTIHWLPQR